MIIKFICNGVKDIPTDNTKSISFLASQEGVSGNVSIVVANGTPASVYFEVGKEYNLDFTEVVA